MTKSIGDQFQHMRHQPMRPQELCQVSVSSSACTLKQGNWNEAYDFFRCRTRNRPMLNQQFSISLLEKEISARNMRQLKTRGKMAPSHLSKIDKKKTNAYYICYIIISLPKIDYIQHETVQFANRCIGIAKLHDSKLGT
jgi:hypothetical protein